MVLREMSLIYKENDSSVDPKQRFLPKSLMCNLWYAIFAMQP
jgi:hypothetical protein